MLTPTSATLSGATFGNQRRLFMIAAFLLLLLGMSGMRISSSSILFVMIMKKFCIMASIVGALGVLTGCSMFQKMPEGKLVSLEYTRSAMRGNEYEVSLTTEANGDVVLRAMKENYGELIEKKLTEEEVAGFVSIIKEEKMYKYKEKYRPLLKVLDGYMWHFNARFEQGSIDSGGSNASPGGEGLNRIKAYAISIVNRKE